MPLTPKGKKIKAAMERPESEGGYGAKKGEQVFYASKNAGKIKGVELSAAPKLNKRVMERLTGGRYKGCE